MDLSNATEAQRKGITHLQGELFIAAGAGSGKTYTLQNRIAFALSAESGPALQSVDEVLAITFMEKAAAEIKSRVRSALREEGKVDEALKVDAAWISTIHGMCARILREYAFEAGIDPAFEVLPEFEAERLRRDAIECVLRSVEADDDDSSSWRGSLDAAACKALFAEFGVVSKGFGESTVLDMLEAILGKAASFRDGLDAIKLCECIPNEGQIARDLLDAYEGALVYGETVRNPKKSQATLEKSMAACDRSRNALESYLLNANAGFADFLEAMEALETIPANAFGNKDEAGREVATDLSVRIDRALRNANALIARPHAHTLIALARQVEAAYQSMLDDRCALDNNGLLQRTFKLLDAREDIKRQFQQRFKLVMVDEFQDTNQMQVDLIELVAGSGKMCMVGDAQQSIYRFNGADVSVFNRRRERVLADVEAGGFSATAELKANFRSDADVLAFVEHVCGSSRVWGDDFLALEACRRGAAGRYKGEGPRINVQLIDYAGSKSASGAVEAEADGIACRFAELREAGHQPSEMVVLMGTTSNVDVYAAALRRYGFECVIGGGRSFFDLEEVRVVCYALTALANPRDSEALFSVLASPMLHLSADDFLALGTVDRDGNLAARGIDWGILSSEEENGSASLAFARRLFERAWARVKHETPSRALMGMLVDSGWFARLEKMGAQGTPVAANVLKALRMIEDLERKPGYGLARVARDFRLMVETQKSAPASLSVADQNAVRLMTVHKSKGLEFPIVAVANYEPWERCSSTFSMTTRDQKIYVAISAKASKVMPGAIKRLSTEFSCDYLLDPAMARDYAEFAGAARKYDWLSEVEEAQRKFYVACTRASEYLLVSGLVKSPKADDPAGSYKQMPILDDVRAALVGEFNDFPEGKSELPYGGSCPAAFDRVYVSSERPFSWEAISEAVGVTEVEGESNNASHKAGLDGASSSVPCDFPQLEPYEPLSCKTVSVRSDVFSYSGIAPHNDHLPIEERDDLSGSHASVGRAGIAGDAEVETAAGETGFVPSATDVGSAFHRVGQLAVMRMGFGKVDGLVLPPAGAVDGIARSYGISGEVRNRLDRALARWFGSDLARTVEGFDRVRAEVPFMVALDFGAGRVDAATDNAEAETDKLEAKTEAAEGEAGLRFLEGEIDLLAESANGEHALVIDYKTGGSPEETPERLQDKHRLQASCYAYALLTTQHYATVDFAFVRVEQEDASDAGQPQVVRYSFAAKDVPALKSFIVKAYVNSDLA